MLKIELKIYLVKRKLVGKIRSALCASTWEGSASTCIVVCVDVGRKYVDVRRKCVDLSDVVSCVRRRGKKARWPVR